MLSLRFVDGGIEVLQADPYVILSEHLLEAADAQYVSIDCGVVTFHAVNGDVRYTLHNHDDLEQTWIGVREGEDLEAANT